MKGALNTILDAVGRTPIVKLNKLGADLEAEICVKCEYLQPSGSAKARMAVRVIDGAEASGALHAGGTIIEATSGNTGAALAMVGAVRGYKCVFVVPDKIAPEKIAALRAYGAKVVVAPSTVEPDDPRSVISVAKKVAEGTPNAFFANQFENLDNPAAFEASLGPEIWEQTGGELDAVVAGIASGGTLMGIGRYLKQKKPAISVVGVDPRGSLYHGLAATGRVTAPSAYQLEGIGSDFVPKILDVALLDAVEQVDDATAFRCTRDLVRLEGIFGGGSSGAAVAGAIAWARRVGGPKKVLVILPDRASNYLSKIFNDDWMRENGFLGDDDGLGTIRDLLQQKGGEGVITAKATDRVRDVVSRMKAHGISQLPVMRGDTLVGAVAEVDLLRHLVSGESSPNTPVEPLAESDYATVATTTRIEEVQALLSDARMAIVLEDGRIVGIVTKIDLIDYLARRAS